MVSFNCKDARVNTFIQVGNRKRQEDHLNVDSENGIYIICDGVGGLQNGDLASRTIIQSITSNYLSLQHPINQSQLKKLIIQAQVDLKITLAKLDNKSVAASTICLLYIYNRSAIILHVGDSRGYYFNVNTRELFSTKDHTIARQLQDAKILTTDREVANHAFNSKLYRSISSNITLTSNSIDVKVIDSITSGDIFFLCTDGVTEVYYYDRLKLAFSSMNNYEVCFKNIKSECNDYSADNNSAIIIQIV